MTHDEALEQHLPEKYLLGELRGDSREGFEEHVFQCTMCAADVADGAVLLGTARQHFRDLAAQPSSVTAKTRRPFLWAAWPFATACLLLVLVGYQNLMELPRLRRELARAEAPAALHELVLAGADARGASDTPTVSIRRDESLLLSVDIQADPRYTAYRCSLRSAGGEDLWKVTVGAAEAHDAVPIRVPAKFLSEGVNSLQVQGVTGAGQDTAQIVASYQFTVQYQR